MERLLAKKEAENRRRLLKWLGNRGQRIGILILLVSIISLYFGGYYLQPKINGPNLISVSAKLYSNTQPASVALGWVNIGRKPVTGGRVLLFTVNKNITKWKKIGEMPIHGGLPGNGEMEIFNIDMHQSLELFLVCMIYVDDNGINYQQVNLYRLGPPTDGPNEIPLIEEVKVRPPSAELCNKNNESG